MKKTICNPLKDYGPKVLRFDFKNPVDLSSIRLLKLSNIYENLCLVLDNEDDKPVEKACHKMCTTSRAGFSENDQSNFIIFDFPKVDVRKAELYFDLERYAIIPEIDFFFKDASG